MAVNKVEAFGETLIDLTSDTVTPEKLAQGETAHNAAGARITGTAVFGSSQSGGDNNSTFIVNAIGTVTADLEKNIVLVDQITSVDKTVAEIMEAAMSGKSVRLCLDITASVKEIMGVPAEMKVSAILYFNLTILTSIVDVIFSAIIDFTGSGIPVVTRIQGALNDW